MMFRWIEPWPAFRSYESFGNRVLQRARWRCVDGVNVICDVTRHVTPFEAFRYITATIGFASPAVVAAENQHRADEKDQDRADPLPGRGDRQVVVAPAREPEDEAKGK